MHQKAWDEACVKTLFSPQTFVRMIAPTYAYTNAIGKGLRPTEAYTSWNGTSRLQQ